MMGLRVFRRTITITSTETWTVSVEDSRPIDDGWSLSPADAAQSPLGSDPNPAEQEQVDTERSIILGSSDDTQFPEKPMIEHDAIIKIEPPTQP
jgi:hypothetical protein